MFSRAKEEAALTMLLVTATDPAAVKDPFKNDLLEIFDVMIFLYYPMAFSRSNGLSLFHEVLEPHCVITFGMDIP